MHGAREPSPGVQVRTEPRGGLRWVSKACRHPWSWGTEMEPRGQAAGDAPSCQEMEGDPLLPASYPLVGQQELQVTLAPVGIRFCPWLQLVPLIVPAVQVLRAQRQGLRECSHGSNGAGRCCSAHLEQLTFKKPYNHWVIPAGGRGIALQLWEPATLPRGWGPAQSCPVLPRLHPHPGDVSHLQAQDHVPQEVVLPFVFPSILKDPEKQVQGAWRGSHSRHQPWCGQSGATWGQQGAAALPPSLLPSFPSPRGSC